MNIPLPFPNGVAGVLHGTWQFRLKTPLFIRHGSKSAYKQQSRDLKKGRGNKIEFAWKNTQGNADKEEWSEIADFNYHFEVNEQGRLTVQYSVPASTIRGVLRQWAIKCLLDPSDRAAFSIPQVKGLQENELADLMKQAREQFEGAKNHWVDILSLFGSAFDVNPGKDDPLTWSGRMRITTQMLNGDENKAFDGIVPGNLESDSPANMKRHVNVRNPIDRVTMAAKQGGLHFGLEMSEGQQFQADFHILNPKPNDIKLLNLWCNDINEGFIRFGGLTSQGRGRAVIEAEKYQLYLSRLSPLYPEVQKLGKPDLAKDTIYDGVWFGAEFTRPELLSLEIEKLEKQ